MKTSVNIIRKLNDFDVVQRTGDGMFNATLLLSQWNKSNKGSKKEMGDYFRNTSTQEFVKSLESEDSLKDGNSPYYKSRGKNGGTWMHPYLFIDFAMWLNPSFKLQVIKFVYDQLIEHRNLSGDYYKTLCSQLARFKDTNFSDVGKILNLVVFNEHKSDRRNSATPEQQNELQQLTRDACMLLEDGFIRSWDKFKEYMRGKWRSRHSKVPKQLI